MSLDGRDCMYRATAVMPLNLNVSNPLSKIGARTGESDPLRSFGVQLRTTAMLCRNCSPDDAPLLATYSVRLQPTNFGRS